MVSTVHTPEATFNMSCAFLHVYEQYCRPVLLIVRDVPVYLFQHFERLPLLSAGATLSRLTPTSQLKAELGQGGSGKSAMLRQADCLAGPQGAS